MQINDDYISAGKSLRVVVAVVCFLGFVCLLVGWLILFCHFLLIFVSALLPLNKVDYVCVSLSEVHVHLNCGKLKAAIWYKRSLFNICHSYRIMNS